MTSVRRIDDSGRFDDSVRSSDGDNGSDLDDFIVDDEDEVGSCVWR